MSDRHDDTTPPFAGHGFACSEPFPLDAANRIEAMRKQIDVLTDQMAARAKKYDEMAAELMACREALHECRGFVEDYGNQKVLELIDARIGPCVLSRIGGGRAG